MKRKIFKNDSDNDLFMTRGAVNLPPLPKEQLEYIKGRFTEMRPADKFDPSSQGRKSSYHCTFLDTNKVYKRQVYELINEVFQPFIDTYLNNYVILNANFYVKPPGKGEFEVHENWTHVVDQRDVTLTIWMPLQDTIEQNGTLEIVAGSHKISADISTYRLPIYFRMFEDKLKKEHLKPVPMKAGECIVFDDSLLHYSKANLSDTIRTAIQILIVPKEVTPVFFYCETPNQEQLEYFAVDPDFFIEESNADIIKQKPAHTRWRGIVKNNNRELSYDEFLDRLKRGNEIRKEFFDGSDN